MENSVNSDKLFLNYEFQTFELSKFCAFEIVISNPAEVSFCQFFKIKIQKINNSNVFFQKYNNPRKIRDRDQPPGLKRDRDRD